VVVGEEDLSGVELLKAVDPRRRERERLRVTDPARVPGQDVGAVGGRGVMALPRHDDAAVTAAHDEGLVPGRVSRGREQQDGRISVSPSSSTKRDPSTSSGNV